MSSSVKCSRHPEEKLRFLCVKCNTPICRDCKMTHHEGHTTTDLDLVASDLRQRLQQEKEGVDSCRTTARLLQGRVRSALNTLDMSAEETRMVMQKKAKAVEEWAETCRLVMEKRLRELTWQSRAEMEAVLEHLNHNVVYLDQLATAMEGALKDDARAEHLAKVLVEYEQNHKGRFPADREMTLSAAAHSRILTHTASSPDLCQSAIERYLGFALVTRMVKTLPPFCQWNFSTRVQRQDNDPGRRVLGLLPLTDGTLCMIYQDGEASNASTAHLALYSPDGMKRQEQEVGKEGVVMVEPKECRLALFSVASQTWQAGGTHTPTKSTDADLPRKNPPAAAAVFLQHDLNGNTTSVCEVRPPLPGETSTVSGSAAEVVVEMHDVPDAVKVTSSASGSYFAVLRKRQEVRVYQHHASTPLSSLDVASELKQAELRDLCFGRVRDRELLIVAEAFYGVLLIADHLDGCVLTAFLPSPLPSPSCVCADAVTGRLWVGGEGGEVAEGAPVSSLPAAEEEDVCYDDLEEDEGGYLVPSPDLYVNIRLRGGYPHLASSSSSPFPSEDIPPLRPPSSHPGIPDLPPRPAPTPAPDTDDLGMPLKPPARRASAMVWKRRAHPDLERRIQDRLLPVGELPDAVTPSPAQDITRSLSLPSHPGRPDASGKPPPPPPAVSDRAPRGVSGYENMKLEPVSKDGEPDSGGSLKPQSSQSLPRSASRAGLQPRESWTPESMMEPPKRPPKPGDHEPKRPPKPGDQDPKRPPKPGDQDPKRPPKPGNQEPKRPPKPGDQTSSRSRDS